MSGDSIAQELKQLVAAKMQTVQEVAAGRAQAFDVEVEGARVSTAPATWFKDLEVDVLKAQTRLLGASYPYNHTCFFTQKLPARAQLTVDRTADMLLCLWNAGCDPVEVILQAGGGDLIHRGTVPPRGFAWPLGANPFFAFACLHMNLEARAQAEDVYAVYAYLPTSVRRALQECNIVTATNNELTDVSICNGAVRLVRAGRETVHVSAMPAL